MPIHGLGRDSGGSRLRSGLEKLRAKAGGSLPLQNLIYERTGVDLDRKRLERLAAGGNASLTLAEFEAIEEVAIQEGLGALFFAQPTLLRELAFGRQVRISIGIHRDNNEQKSYCAVFDLMASMCLLQGLERLVGGLSWEIEQVPPRLIDQLEVIPTLGSASSMATQNRTVISLGSSLSNSMSERLLGECFSIPPFRADGLSIKAPFMFVWDEDDDVVSSFGLTRIELAEKWPDARRACIAPQGRRRRGLVYTKEGKRIFKPEFEYSPDGALKERWAYGVLAVRRRYGESPHVVCAGLNGPSTHLVARMLIEGALGQTLPLLRTSEADTYYAIVRGVVTETAECGDNRRVESGVVLHEAHVSVPPR